MTDTPLARAEESHETTQKFVRVIITITAVLLVSFGAVTMVVSLSDRARFIDCTTPGPNKPTEANGFRTGHVCYDNSEGSRNRAVAKIVEDIVKDHERQTTILQEEFRKYLEGLETEQGEE